MAYHRGMFKMGGAAILFLALAACAPRPERPAEPAPPAAEPAPRDPLIDLLRAKGINLAKPRPLTFYGYFTIQASAEQAALRLKDADFVVRVDPPREGVPEWSLKATRETIIDEATVAKLGGLVSAVVTQYGGEYDGWETPADR